MTTVEAGLVYDPKKHCQVPVWCLKTKTKGKETPFTVFWERKPRVNSKGQKLAPVGTVDHVTNGDGTTMSVIQAFKIPSGMRSIKIHTEADGFVAPDHWYVSEEGDDSEDAGETVLSE